jgi:hypothetical protein
MCAKTHLHQQIPGSSCLLVQKTCPEEMAMGFDDSHHGSSIETSRDSCVIMRFRIPLAPALLGVLAAMNVASVVLTLVE